MIASFSSTRRQRDIDASRIDRANCSFRDFGTDSVAGDESAVMGHIFDSSQPVHL